MTVKVLFFVDAASHFGRQIQKKRYFFYFYGSHPDVSIINY